MKINTTINISNGQEQAKRRGRPRGSRCYANVTMADLAQYVGPLGTIVVSRRWLKTLNFPMQ